MSYAGEGESESTWARRRRKVMQWGIASISVGLLAACGQAPPDPASSATAGTATPVLRKY